MPYTVTRLADDLVLVTPDGAPAIVIIRTADGDLWNGTPFDAFKDGLMAEEGPLVGLWSAWMYHDNVAAAFAEAV